MYQRKKKDLFILKKILPENWDKETQIPLIKRGRIISSREVIINPASTQNEGNYTYTFTKENFEESGLAGTHYQRFYQIILTAGNKHYTKKIIRTR